MTVVSVRNLTKTFQFKVKRPGFKGSLRSIVKPVYKEVEAVKGINFEISEGEVVAFIGPNGAGKSTTIKMLSGILYPSSGEAKVCGMVPWQQRQKLAYKIGTVFGQRPQLWYHLPAIETFNLFSKIYELDQRKYKNRLKWLIDHFEIGEYVENPVRKLSLGQRMRCEIVASLLHSPGVIFLDEPTIGLDVVAKQQIREAIKYINREEGTTIFLTSHDASDIEKITRRTIIINLGEVIFDGETRSLRWDYIKTKVIGIRFKDSAEETIDISGVKVLKQTKIGAKLEVDTTQTEVELVLRDLLKKHKIADINVTDPPMEEIIRLIYRGQENKSGS